MKLGNSPHTHYKEQITKIPKELMKQSIIGSTITTNEGYVATVVGKGSKRNYYSVQIGDWEKDIAYAAILTGSIKYPLHKAVAGIGYLGIGKYSRKSNQKVYDVWASLVKRNVSSSEIPTYKNVKVCRGWYNFQVFAEWFNSATIPTSNRLHPLFKTWQGEKSRCLNPKHKSYMSYGGRGISISEEFMDFSIWVAYVTALPDYGTGKKLQLDRIDNDGNYERGNLRWATLTVQGQNTVRLQTNNTSGYRGVSWNKNRGRWTAQIRFEGKKKTLGYFKDVVEAAKTYDSFVIANGTEHTTNGLI